MMSALRMGLFSAVPRDAGAAAMTTVELAAKTGGDRVLISRLPTNQFEYHIKDS